MPLSEITVDVSEWNRRMITQLIGFVREADRELSLHTENPQPKKFEEAYRKLITWHSRWKQDTRSYVSDEKLHLSIRRSIQEARPYNIREEWKFGLMQWVEPGVSGISYYPETVPPSFSEMIDMMAEGKECPLRYIGPKYGQQLLEYFGKQSQTRQVFQVVKRKKG